jgi:hypothetical protein
MMIKRATARWPLVLLFVVFTEVITHTKAQTPEKAGILRPTDQAVHETEEVQVIAGPGELWLLVNPQEQTQAMRQALSLLFQPEGTADLEERSPIEFSSLSEPQEHRGAGVEGTGASSQAECQTVMQAAAGLKKITIRDVPPITSKTLFSRSRPNDEVLAECIALPQSSRV